MQPTDTALIAVRHAERAAVKRASPETYSSITRVSVSTSASHTDTEGLRRAARASLLADETATLAIVVAGLRSLRDELARCADIDALGTPASYRLAQEAMDALLGDLAAMLDTRQWADVDRRAAA